MAVMMSTKPNAPAASALVTADQLLQLPENGARYELVKGDLIEMGPASPRNED